MPPRVAVVGPTASGKSAVAMAVALERQDTDVVSVDSMQVYRGMNIGTAKPTHRDQRRVRHHLIDLVDAGDDFTVAAFQRAYREAIAAIAAAGRSAILVGGTGLYHRVVIDDFDIPGRWPEVRADLEDAADADLDALYRRLTSIDPVAAAKIEPTNRRRIVRAMEVCEGSGRPFSSFGPGLETYPSSPVHQIGLRWEPDALEHRIAQRVTAMIDAGFVDEVAELVDGGLSRTAQQALGYRELIDYLDGTSSLESAISQIVTRTRQFASRQRRWFRRDPRIQWVDISTDPISDAAPVVAAALTAAIGYQP